jgi:predicted O-methyltransferase YrrM
MRIFNEDGTPMMAEREIQIIVDLLNKHQARHCLEWGAGTSSVYFPKNNPFLEHWLAIEHNKVYDELFGEEAKKYHSEIVVVPESEYITFPRKYNKKFDFILIDGLFREECVDEAFNLIAENGIILLHDAGRIESAPILKKYEGRYTILIEGELMQSNGYYAHRGIAQFHTK